MIHDNSFNTQILQPSSLSIYMYCQNEPEAYLSSNEYVERFEQFIIWRTEDITIHKK